MATVDQLMDEVENNSEIDVIGITDHDDCRSFEMAQRWKERHPDSRLSSIWGCEVTAFGFTHILAFRMEPPYPTRPPKKFLALHRAVEELKDQGCYIVAPHVDAPFAGIGRGRLERVASELGFYGYELLTPYFTSDNSLPALRELGDRHNLVALGGPDAHFMEDLYRIVLRFDGQSVSDFHQSWQERTVYPEKGTEGPKVTMRRKLQQQRRSLLEHPGEQIRAWVQQQGGGR